MTAPLPPLTDAEIAEIEVRHAKATAGTWTAEPQPKSFGQGMVRSDAGTYAIPCSYIHPDDGIFIAAAHQDIPRLVADLRRCRAALRNLCDAVHSGGFPHQAVALAEAVLASTPIASAAPDPREAVVAAAAAVHKTWGEYGAGSHELVATLVELGKQLHDLAAVGGGGAGT